jgi:hypothetical protein
MIIDLRKDAPDQTDNVDPEKLSQEVEKLKSVQNQIQKSRSTNKRFKRRRKIF